MTLDLEALAQGISNHVSTCPPARFLCTTQASFESWFRVELVPVLMEMGIDFDAISPDYTYPGTHYKADLVYSGVGGRTILELKSFVSGQDANKQDRYPVQIERLRSLLAQEASIAQVITFTTFQGYSPPTRPTGPSAGRTAACTFSAPGRRRRRSRTSVTHPARPA